MFHSLYQLFDGLSLGKGVKALAEPGRAKLFAAYSLYVAFGLPKTFPRPRLDDKHEKTPRYSDTLQKSRGSRVGIFL